MAFMLANKLFLSSTPAVSTVFKGVVARNVHSKRQIKRLMAPYHPAYRRKNRELLKKVPELPTPQYAAIGEPVLLSNGWSKPLLEENSSERPAYPFHVKRTKNKPMGAVGFLPVYAKCRNDRTKVSTLVKGVTGDREAFSTELRAVLQTPKPFKLRGAGTVLEVPGDNVALIKTWLTGLGF